MNEIIKKNGINQGIIAGIASILWYILIYLVDVKLFVEWWVNTLLYILYIALGVMLLSKTKKQLNGILSFKDAFTTYFIYAVIGTLIFTTFNYIFFNFVDPQAAETIKTEVTAKIVGMMQKFGTPSSDISKIVEEMQKQDTYSLMQQVKGAFFSILISSIFGLILALIFKTKPSANY